MILDRIEGGLAVLELPDGSMIEVPAELLPAGAKEGDCLRLVLDEEATAQRRAAIKGRMNRLFRD